MMMDWKTVDITAPEHVQQVANMWKLQKAGGRFYVFYGEGSTLYCIGRVGDTGDVAWLELPFLG